MGRVDLTLPLRSRIHTYTILLLLKAYRIRFRQLLVLKSPWYYTCDQHSNMLLRCKFFFSIPTRSSVKFPWHYWLVRVRTREKNGIPTHAIVKWPKPDFFFLTANKRFLLAQNLPVVFFCQKDDPCCLLYTILVKVTVIFVIFKLLGHSHDYWFNFYTQVCLIYI